VKLWANISMMASLSHSGGDLQQRSKPMGAAGLE